MVKGYDKSLRERVDRRMQVRAAVAITGFSAAMVFAAREQHAHWQALSAAFWLYVLALTLAGRLLFGRVERLIPNLVFTVANTLFALSTMWALEFRAPGFLVIPMMVLLIDGFSEGDARWWVLGMLAVLVVLPVAFGASPLRVGAAALAGWLVHWFSEARAATLRAAMAELQSQTELLSEINGELGELQHKMLAQERLSSLGVMAAGVAHEINNPLAFVASNVNALSLDLDQLAHDPALLEEYRSEVVPATIEGLSRVAEIVSALRRFARADPAKKEVFELEREVQGAVRVCKSQIDDHCDLTLQLEPGLWINGQAGQLGQVLINLVANATFAMRQKRGRLTISTRREDDAISLVVEDQGEGMDAQTLSRIFEPFFTTKPQGVGTGLGLSVVHGIVRAHGGLIEASSVPGEGTRFVVRLPAAAAPTGTQPAQAA